jgi:hypothetical protein
VGRLMALHARPGADLKGPRIRDHISSSYHRWPLGPCRRRLSQCVQGRRMADFICVKSIQKGLIAESVRCYQRPSWTAVPMRVG